MFGSSNSLEEQQDPPHGLQGYRPQRDQRRHRGHPQGRQRRELLWGAEEQHGRDEEQRGQVQRSQVYRAEWAREEFQPEHPDQLGPAPGRHLLQVHEGDSGRSEGTKT